MVEERALVVTVQVGPSPTLQENLLLYCLSHHTQTPPWPSSTEFTHTHTIMSANLLCSKKENFLISMGVHWNTKDRVARLWPQTAGQKDGHHTHKANRCIECVCKHLLRWHALHQ